MNSLQQRLLLGTGTALIVLLLLSLSYTPLFQPLIPLLFWGVVGAALWEYYQFARSKGSTPLEKTAIGLSLIYLYALFLTASSPYAAKIPLLFLVFSLLAGFLALFRNSSGSLIDLATTLFGLVYVTLPLGCMIAILYGTPAILGDGRLWLLYLLVVAKSTDVGAYFIGKWLGKNKLASEISPKKTWEGALAGFIAAIALSLLFSLCAWIPLSFGGAFLLGGLVSLLAQIGDLSESLLKRDAGIKDSNRLPGLGGMLDMLDSLIFSTPLLFFYLQFSMEA